MFFVWNLSIARADGQVDDLADLELLRNLAGVGSLNLAGGDAVLLGNGAEGVTRGNGVLAVGARAALADGNDGLVAGEDGVEVGEPALVGVLEGGELEVKVVCDESEGVIGEDLVGGRVDGQTLDAVLGASCLDSVGNAAVRVDGSSAVGWDSDDLAGEDEIGVGDVVDCGDVASTGTELVGNGRQGVTSDDSVVLEREGLARDIGERALAVLVLLVRQGGDGSGQDGDNSEKSGLHFEK